MDSLNEEQKQIIRELRNRLVGRCSTSRDTCPKRISIKHNHYYVKWDCLDCEKHFFWLAQRKQSYYCPCSFIPFGLIDLRFSELLEEEI